MQSKSWRSSNNNLFFASPYLKENLLIHMKSRPESQDLQCRTNTLSEALPPLPSTPPPAQEPGLHPRRAASNRLCDFKIFQHYIYSLNQSWFSSGSLAPLLKLTFKYRLIFQGDSLEYSFTLVRVVFIFSDACSHPPPSSLPSSSLFPSFFNKYFGACTLCLAVC